MTAVDTTIASRPGHREVVTRTVDRLDQAVVVRLGAAALS